MEGIKLFEGRVRVVEHPLAQAILTVLRDKNTDQIAFRKGLVKLGRLIGYELIKDMPTEEILVETPLNVNCLLYTSPSPRD